MLENVSVCGSSFKVAKNNLDRPNTGVDEYAVSTLMNSMLRQSRHPTTEEKFRGSKGVASSKKLDTLESESDSKEIAQLIPRRKLRINSAEDGGLLNAPHTFVRPNQEIPRQINEPMADFAKSIRQELDDCSISDSF